MDTCSAGEVVQAKAGPRHSSSRNIICAVASECKMLMCFLSQIQVKGAELYVNTSEALLHFQLPVSITVTEKMLAPAKLQCK